MINKTAGGGKMYKPEPINTDHIGLPDDLIDLTEDIARQVHEIWALGRINDGWIYGEKRDDGLKTTPCLVPYEELSESEKAFDRNTAMSAIRLIKALGYRIEKDR
ncbi:MAG: Ryanodine receptor Ryr [Clostridia bacterium]|nr:Ryanodine receptor Ryr [Clostridia bacterium]